MKLARRTLLRLAAAAAALPAVCRAARAQAYPSRPVRIVVGQSAGSGTDTAARLIAQWLSNHLGQPFVVENQPGAAGNIATAAVVRAPADGYTLGTVISANAINETLYDNLAFSFVRDIAPVAGIFRVPLVMVVNPSVSAQSVPEFIAYAKANPGKINFGSPGIGSTGHLAAELFKAMAGVDLVHVPYRGAAPAMADLMAGHVQVVFDSMVSVLPHVQGGRVRALAVTSKARSPLLPDLPAIAETIPGYEAIIWFGVGVPRGTPDEVIARLNREINAGLASAEMKEKFAKLGTTPMVMTPEEFWGFARGETEKWREVIERAGIKVE